MTATAFREDWRRSFWWKQVAQVAPIVFGDPVGIQDLMRTFHDVAVGQQA